MSLPSTSFVDVFGESPEVEASAPGRVNLIGEHTDYQNGYVLPMAIPRYTTVAIRRNAGPTVRAASRELAEPEPRAFVLGAETPGLGWLDHVQGVTVALERAGHRLSGFDAGIRSDIPLGGGLASSAALAVALLRALRIAFRLPLNDLEIAHLAHRAETEFVGAPVGVMDQMVCSLVETDSLLFLDTRSRAFERLRLPAGVSVAVVDSGVAHRHAAGPYRERRAQAEAAARALDVETLRELAEGDLSRALRLPEPLGRRARHVVTENARVLAFVAAMAAGDLQRMGELLDQSHASLRDDYEASGPEVDLLVRLAQQQPGVWGARLTGGGFGGAVVMLTEPGAPAAKAVAQDYARETGRAAQVLLG